MKTPDHPTLRRIPQEGWAVYRGAERLSQIFRDHAKAERALDRIEAREAKARDKTIRACLCCGRDFKANGRFNRLCSPCAARGEAIAV